MKQTQRQILKADGTIQEFKWEKFEKSLLNSKTDEIVISKLKNKLDRTLPNLVSSDQLRSKANNYLSKYQPKSGYYYGLREAIMKLGPTGYGFEIFISQIFESLGYHTNQGIILKGKCVSHEIDVMVSKNESVDLIECKFHNHFGIKSDVKISLYLYGRLTDLKDSWSNNGVQNKLFGNFWLATNTKVTKDAYDFAVCRGIKILSWDRPENLSLKFLVDKAKIIPITALKSLSTGETQKFIDSGIVTCQQLLNITYTKGIEPNILYKATKEAELCLN